MPAFNLNKIFVTGEIADVSTASSVRIPIVELDRGREQRCGGHHLPEKLTQHRWIIVAGQDSLPYRFEMYDLAADGRLLEKKTLDRVGHWFRGNGEQLTVVREQLKDKTTLAAVSLPLTAQLSDKADSARACPRGARLPTACASVLAV